MKNSSLCWGTLGALLLTCAWVAGPARAAWQGALQVEAESGPLVVYSWAEGARVEMPGGAPVDLPLPGSAELSSLAALPRGFLLAGSIKDAEGDEVLRLWRGSRAGVVELAAPDRQKDRLRLRPILLARDGRVRGLAWLEGGTLQSLGVWASAWQDGGWTRPEKVAGPGPGSQLALAGTVLADGTWVLVWSGFDGGDDEIFVARRPGERWQAPRRLHAGNDVFDITPTVSAFEEDALVSWSRYDGTTYRLIVARLEGDRLVEERMIGESGSVLPRFVLGSGTPDLVYYAAEGATWRVAELDRRGRVLRRAAAAGHVDRRPLLLRAGGAGELVWRRQERAEALSFREEAP